MSPLQRRTRRTSFRRSLAAAALVLAVAAVGLFLWALLGPLPADPMSRLTPGPTVFVDRNGTILYVAPDAERGLRLWTPLDSIAASARAATVDTEDARFFARSFGLDPLAMVRAGWQTLRGNGARSGASTIEEQLARTLYFAPEQRQSPSISRKLTEWVWALRLGHRLSHDRLLELYLNAVDYGNGAVGIEAAAQIYFGKPARDLDLAQAALLAGLPQAPSRYDPLRFPRAALARRVQVLELMRGRGSITRAQADAADAEALELTPRQHPLEAPYFVDMARQELVERLGTGQQTAVGLTVHTTLDLGLQRAAEESVAHGLAGLKENDVTDAALVALDPRTGEVLALVGGADYFDPGKGGNFNAATALRQPGSAIKPIVYAAALSSGMTAATELDDVHSSFADDLGGYAPNDYDNTFHGPVALRVALASSLNVPAVAAFQQTGREAVLQVASRMGLGVLASSAAGPSLALGGGEVRLLDLTAAYAAFDNGGSWQAPSAIARVDAAAGHTVYRSASATSWAVSPQVAYLLSDILSDDDARALGFGYHSALGPDRPAAAKTGTTSDFRDNWTVGYTPDLVVGVWTGNADGRPMRDVSGVSGAAPIWHEFMERTLAGRTPRSFTRPEGLVSVNVCPPTGLLPGVDCPHTSAELFVAGTEPHEVESYYRAVAICPDSGLSYTAACPSAAAQRVFPFPRPELIPWMRDAGIELPPVPPYVADDVPAGGDGSSVASRTLAQALILLSPDQNAVYHISPELPPSQQAITIEAAPRAAGIASIRLLVDGNILADVAAPPYRAIWNLQPGVHTVVAEATRSDGQAYRSAEVRFTVEP